MLCWPKARDTTATPLRNAQVRVVIVRIDTKNLWTVPRDLVTPSRVPHFSLVLEKWAD